jgi:hypothetical protein
MAIGAEAEGAAGAGARGKSAARHGTVNAISARKAERERNMGRQYLDES